MYFTMVGTIVLCLMAAVSGSSFRERGLSGAMQSSSKKKAEKVCSLTDLKKAAALGSRLLAEFWEDILNTDCTKDAIYTVFNAYFDENIVLTSQGQTVATGREDVNDAIFQVTQDLCKTPGVFVSWFAQSAEIDKVKTNVLTLNTARMVSVPANNNNICGDGFSYTGKVLGEKCDTAKLTEIGSDSAFDSTQACTF